MTRQPIATEDEESILAISLAARLQLRGERGRHRHAARPVRAACDPERFARQQGSLILRQRRRLARGIEPGRPQDLRAQVVAITREELLIEIQAAERSATELRFAQSFGNILSRQFWIENIGTDATEKRMRAQLHLVQHVDVRRAARCVAVRSSMRSCLSVFGIRGRGIVYQRP